MLGSLISLLLFETVQPAHMTLATLLPPEVTLSAPTLKLSNTPTKKGDSVAPALDAGTVFAVDLDSGKPLYVKNIFVKRPIASITKLMTAMVILDNHSPDEVIEVSHAAATTEGSRMFLRSGELISIENAIHGLLINSGNDAAVALAEYDAGNVEAFVKKMNAKARVIGMRDSNFANPMGFDDPNGFSTAFDVIIMGRAALTYPLISSLVSQTQNSVKSKNGGLTHSLKNTNELLSDPNFKVIGIKTGRTEGAGESLLALTEGPNQHQIMTVVLNSPARFQETRVLLDWIFRNYIFHPSLLRNL